MDKANYLFDDLANMDILAYDQLVFDKSLDFFIETLQDYERNNVNVNLINIAKSKPFSDHVLSKLRSTFDNQNT